MTRDQLRQHALSTLRKFGGDAIEMGQVPAVKEQELLLFMYALIDRVVGANTTRADDEAAARVRRAGGFVPKV